MNDLHISRNHHRLITAFLYHPKSSFDASKTTYESACIVASQALIYQPGRDNTKDTCDAIELL